MTDLLLSIFTIAQAPAAVGDAQPQTPSELGSPECAVRPEAAKLEPEQAGSRRLLPSWIGVIGATAGIGFATIGAVILPYDLRCASEAELGFQQCPKLWRSKPGAYAMMGTGGALMLASVVLLAVDSRRARPSGERRVAFVFPGVLRF